MAEIISGIPNMYYCQKKSNIIKDIIKGKIASDSFDYAAYTKAWEQQPLAVMEYMDRQKKARKSFPRQRSNS
uniref:Uncharacterized protein n=1 Tax=Chryseobacterium endophyticum TaxID=1854762 RepID=A0AAU6WTW3_9FLAO